MKRAAKGTVLKMSISGVYTTVAQVKKVDYPDDETEFYDATTLDSTDKEDGETTGFSVPGSVSCDLFYDPVDVVHQAIIISRVNRWKENWNITNPNIGTGTAHVVTFSGRIKKFKPTAAVGSGLEASLEIKLTSVSSYNVATGNIVEAVGTTHS